MCMRTLMFSIADDKSPHLPAVVLRPLLLCLGAPLHSLPRLGQLRLHLTHTHAASMVSTADKGSFSNRSCCLCA
jgi:hypothetical protein